MNISRHIILTAIFLMTFVARVFAATEVTSITANPSTFNPIINQTTTFSVQATPGVTGLEVRVLLPDQITLVRSGLALTETSPGTYTTTWDGKNDSNTGVVTGNYAIRVFNPGTTTYIGPWSEATIAGLSINPTIFSPNGTNVATITVQATPSRVGMYVNVDSSYYNWRYWSGKPKLALTETATPGVYTVNWNAVGRGYYVGYDHIWPDGTYNVTVLDSADQQLPSTGKITIAGGVSAVTVSPVQFNAMSGATATITATGGTGLSLQARLYKSGTLFRILPMTGNGSYTATWDGRDESGNLVPLGSYEIQVFNTGSSARYNASTSVQVSVGVSSITVNPNPYTPTGTNLAVITVEATPGQVGMYINVDSSYYNWRYWSGKPKLVLTETATPGVYTVNWNAVGRGYYAGFDHIWPDGIYNVTVLDNADQQLPATGKVTIAGGISAVSVSPSQFNAMGGATATITATGGTGLSLQARLYKSGTLFRTLPMTGNGSYTATWDGRDESGNFVPLGNYEVQIFNAGSSVRYSPTTSVQVSIGVSSITTTPNPYTPNGTNVSAITVQATPGQVGMYVNVDSSYYNWRYWSGKPKLALTETATPGVYTVNWSAVGRGYYVGFDHIWPDGTYNITVLDSADQQLPTTGKVTIIGGVSAVTVSPSQFNAIGGATATITATGGTGLSLQARLYKSGTLFRTLPMTGNGSYTATWDGRDESGNLVALGSYEVQIFNAGSSVRYSPATSVQVSIGVSSITTAPNPYTPTGTNSSVITVVATPGQVGMYVNVDSSYYNWRYWSGKPKLALTETATPGVYTVNWDAVGRGYYAGFDHIWPDGIYNVTVLDSVDQQSVTTGKITISGISTVSVSSSQFTPGGNNYVTITAKGAVGKLFDARIYNASTNALTRVLPLTEVAGTYTVDWDGKDAYGNFAGANNYTIQLAARDSSIRYYPTSSLKVNVAVFTISASPDPFVPDGINSTTITVRADALQSGLKATVSHPQSGTSAQLPLREAGSAGTYTTTWDGKINGAIPRDGIYTIRIYDSAGNQFPATGTFTLSSAKSLTVIPSPFEITGSSTTTISAQMPSGLHLEARIGSLKTLSLTETAGTYSAVWDGKDSSGVFAPAGTYNVAIWNIDTQTRYDLQISLQVRIVDSVPPDTSITSGPAEGSYVTPTNITFNWTGTDNLAGPLTYAYQLDSEAWSAFDAATNHTFTTLADGVHTFSVKAKDQAGNEDPTPAVRRFTVDGTAPQPASGLTATPTQTGIRLDWAHSPSADVYSYKFYWDNGTGTVSYAAPFATIYYPTKTFTASIFREGSYKYALRAVDRAGNEEQNTDLIASATISGFSVTVDTNGAVHKRGEDVQLTGTVLASDSTPLVNIPVTIEVESKGYVRTYSAYTKANGGFSYLFQPLASEAGSYTVKARVLYQGLEKSASASFSIIGMLLEPAQVTIDMSMNSPKTVNINLRNIGSTAMTGLQYALVDADLSDPVKGFIDTASLPTSLAAGTSAIIPVLVTADPGTPPSVPATFTLNVVSSDGTSETARITARLHDAVSLPVFNPDPIMVGVRTGEPVTKTVTIINQGYATMQDSTLTVHDPATYSWVSIPNGTFGTFSPQEAKSCQIVVNPPEGTTLGTYVVQLDLKYNNGTTKPVYMTVEVTTSTVGQVAFKVHDDTGSVVTNAEVNLISKAFYVNVTPNGRQEYNNVLKGTTNAQGYILFSDVPAGDYRYVVNAVRHDQKDGLITVEPGSTPQTIGVIMVTNLVNVDFSVTQTTIQDQYNVNLNITYVTDLVKPTLYATPYRVDLSFFPEESPFQGSITIKNTSNNAPVRDVTLDASMLDGTDNEIKIVFDDGTEAGTQKINLGELGFGQSIQVPYKAVIYGSSPKLNSRNLGNIIATAKYTFSIDGQANESTTTTPIPVLYWKPQELGLPGISYLNDETNNQSCNLQYQGTTYRMNVKSNRNMGISLDSLKAVNHVSGGPDAASIISGNSSMWTGSFTPTTLSAKGEVATFDIDDLQAALENRCKSDRSNFLGKPNFIGFTGTWTDRTQKDAYLIPISIITKSTTGIYISDSSPGGGSWVGGTIPTFNEHGTVKMQIDQKVSLEREAFNAKLNIKPSVTPLNNFKVQVSIKDENGDDASGKFFVVVTQKTGIASVDGSTVSGPVDITWQLIPNSDAGGTSASGKNYSIAASIDYNYSNGTYSYTTQSETITVRPMPKLTIDYKLPYVTMAGKPVKIKAIVTNNGYGPAHNLVIKSAQPKIIENQNNVPVSFTLLGSSATPNDNTLNSSSLDINFGDIPAGGTVEGYWLLSTTKDGYFVEFTSTLTHHDYMGVQLDPLIEAVNTKLIPAIGGEIFMPPNTTEGMKVELYQGGVLKGQDTVNSYGNYLIPDLTAGGYQWAVKDSSGNTVVSRVITVLDGQPTARIDYGVSEIISIPDFQSKSESTKKLILITHGWNSNAGAFANEMVDNICNQFGVTAESDGLTKWCVKDDWEVKSYDWSDGANEKHCMTFTDNDLGLIGLPTVPFVEMKIAEFCIPKHPKVAYGNAFGVGEKLGKDIASKGYEFVHLVGHSAGSNVVHTASMNIPSTTKTHITLLDAFDPSGISSPYGSSSTWAEQYVDTRSLFITDQYGKVKNIAELIDGPLNLIPNVVEEWAIKMFSEGLDSLETTDTNLPHVYNFDITNIDSEETNSPIKRHSWPYRFYSGTSNLQSISSLADTVGFKFSKEFSDINMANKENTVTWEPYGRYFGPYSIKNQKLYPKGGSCQMDTFDYSSCGCTKEQFDAFECENQSINYESEKVDLTSTIKIAESKSGTNVITNEALQLATGSPSWVTYKFITVSNKNTINFNFEYLSNSDGVLSVYLDGSFIYKNFERISSIGGVKNTGRISLGIVKPGEHEITFRLDKQSSQSIVKISDIELGLVQVAISPPSSDTVKPVSLVTYPTATSVVNSTQISLLGNANDATGSGVKTVEVSLDGGTTWIPAEGTASWTYNWNVPANGTYTVLSRATDNAGNVEIPSAGVTFTVSLPDLVAPSGSISVHAADNYTKTTAIILDLAANDPSGVTQVCISNTETCTDWQSFAQSIPWQLTSGNGLKTVRAWFRDGVGNSNTQPYSTTITLDTEAPSITLYTLDNGASTNNATLNIPGTVTDNMGVKSLTIDGNLVQVASDNSFSYALVLKVGQNTVTVTATDLADNPTTVSRVITYDPNAPVLTILAPVDNSRTNKSFVDVTGTIDENASVEVKVNTAQPEVASIDGNKFTYSANLVAGPNTIEVIATDLANNVAHDKRTIVYDNLSPSLAITYPAQDITTSQSSVTLKGTVSDALTAVSVAISVDNQTFNPPVVNGEFEQTVTFTTAKSYAITVTATDEALNSTSVQRNIIYAPQKWSDVTAQTAITKSTTIYDRLNNCYYANIAVRNSATVAINGPVRMVIVNPSIPLKTNLPVGLKPDGYTSAGEPYFNIVPQTGTLAAGATISNLRVNFEVQRVALTYGVRIEQYK
ncbi:Ig-like domain-containing protein [Geobacter anodireducens]